MTAIDSAGSGFNVTQEAFVTLNGGQIGQGTLDVVAERVDRHICGLAWMISLICSEFYRLVLNYGLLASSSLLRC